MGWLANLFGPRRSVADLERQGIPPKRRFTTRVAGVSFKNPDGVSRQDILRRLRPGHMAVLLRQPDNPKDPDAVAVIDPHYGQFGFIPADIAARLASQLDQGMAGFARVTEIMGGTRDKPSLGCAVEVLLYDSDTEIPNG